MSYDQFIACHNENKRPVTVNAGLLMAALHEIQENAKVNGEGLLTSVIIKSIEEALKR
ncbi:MAG: hypothetical protein [Bacteriophage sp.]|nr:MAG: hypothetical protein [Bacteriophage sp.]